MRRLILWGLRWRFGGPARSWVFTGAFALASAAAGRLVRRRPVVETIRIGPGDHLTIDQLRVSHKRQIRQQRRDRRAARRTARRTAGASP